MLENGKSAQSDDIDSDARLARRFAWALGAASLALIVVAFALGTEWRDAIRTALEKGRRLRDVHYGHWGVWWGCAVDAALCATLALTTPWWARTSAARGPAAPAAPPMTGRGWLALVAILAVAGALRWERAGLSFYNDEGHSYRRYIGGQHLRQDDGTVQWRQVTWTETVWLNKVGNNSVPCSLLGRLSYDAWRKLTGAADGALGERAVRLPVLLAAMAGLVVLWLLLRRMWPGSHACWWVLVLAALHPWHVRYSSEARGHGFLLLGIPLCFYFFERAREDDRWRWWIGMGLAEFFCAASFPGAISFLGVFNGLLVLLLAWHAWRKQGAWARLLRPLAGMLFGVMVGLPVMLPIMRQLLEVMKTLPSLMGHMGIEWWQDVLGLLLGGVGWSDLDIDNSTNLALARITALHPWAWLLLAATLVPLAAGVWRVAKRRHFTGWLALAAGPTAAITMWTLMSLQDKVLYLWYVIFMLPGLLILWAAGADALIARARSRTARVAAWTLLLAPLAGHAWVDARIITHGKEDLRGLARAVPKSAIHATLFSDVDLYDGAVIILHDPGELDAVVQRARALGRPLYVSFSRRSKDPTFQAFYQRLAAGTEFEQAGVFWGQDDPQFTHYLYRLKEQAGDAAATPAPGSDPRPSPAAR